MLSVWKSCAASRCTELRPDSHGRSSSYIIDLRRFAGEVAKSRNSSWVFGSFLDNVFIVLGLQAILQATMASLLRKPIRSLAKVATPKELAPPTRRAPQWEQHVFTGRRNLASAVPPVMQDGTGSLGPTAIVFMNMGGPSTVDEVGDFLSRLFVCHAIRTRFRGPSADHACRQMATSSL